MTTDPNELRRWRAAAERAADAAAEVIACALESGDWTVREKADATPVTDVDVAAERAIRAVLAEATPEAGFFGEETGRHAGAAGADDGGAGGGSGAAMPRLRWLVDPIDGTKSFVRGLPFYATEIALEVDGELVVGVSHAPAFGAGQGERLVGVRGEGAWLDGRSARTSAVDDLAAATLSSGNIGSLARDVARWTRYGELVAAVGRTRGYGDFYHYHRLATGGVDLVVESDVNVLDVAALAVALRAAGGTITDLEGRAIGEDSRSVLAAATPELHARALALLSASPDRASRPARRADS